ncbi:MAG: hypothetical protein UX85_C0005G0019 [Candidatus Beckwithbacteria bacterium GW2011_GWB1_47_15]|uniref:Glycosyltransferase RgtA/B/C/D-like domain-containing protein n=1 Tax=Candidatus Beckwithbacteria bacterium GW2011_GWB1_47_15 TaxID=1618371 RepID=A0A0G1RV44_9BACT|nr:MAG: Uncharacterized protein UY43_C0001G0749 [Candidatus Beckwithbacteria bacterium GW2011_GWC1_49_16]KKU35727.1 MAG: hypothetical protein UX50_C0002G0154 [Candidatus Beckwithbacteria bacterium GW2011_GWA1_46_30]KKU60981.1 MAG: hypothetical protein UX85_C0005G0019 [Candidatus Beckwithbacteria bacterium GW2011_GWB1_47_15]KKU72286.1 MAG: hypothetical protein UX97_C0001G0156 [Candidatus Beckwithbacteria bacterium GW2011_GWA2_47_25]KKW04954.1 MAG: hypothetical protein UY37_C0001G0058 [Candidatus
MSGVWRRLKSFWKQNKLKLPLLLGLAAILALSFKIAQARSLSLHFGDEEDHIAFAYFVNRGYRLHRDLQNNHQPLVYFASAAIQKITQPDNIFMLIRRHRQTMYVYGALWSVILVWRFKGLGLLFVTFFEFLKYFLFGNINLMETQAVYPAVYLFAVMLEVWFKRVLPRKKEAVFLGLNAFLVIFNMVPLWPWLLMVYGLFWFKARKSLKWQALGLGLGILVLFAGNYSPIDWFRETVWNNFFYAIPDLSPFKSSLDWAKMVFFPFLALVTPGSLMAKFIAMFFSGWLVTCGYLVYRRDKMALAWGGTYLFLMLANNRVLSPGAVFYHGFHLLPWLGLMIFLFGFGLRLVVTEYPKLKLGLVAVFGLWGFTLMTSRDMPYFLLNTDVNYEYYVNYSTLDDVNFAIKTLTAPGDRLAVTANEPLLYWNSGAELPTRQVVYGGWEPKVKSLRQDYNQVFYGDAPPEIIYGGDEPKLLNENYANISRFGKATELFVRRDKFDKITQDQWQALSTRGFHAPGDKDYGKKTR